MLKDKVAVVTGAGRGIGRAIAKTFAGYGAKVVVNYNGSEERANSLVAEIKEAGGEAVAYKANVADFAEAEGLIKFALEQYGRVDILVNNAGITRDNIMLGMKEEDFDQVININLKGAFNCIKHVYRPMMKQKYGRIINMSSVVGIEGNAGQINYFKKTTYNRCSHDRTICQYTTTHGCCYTVKDTYKSGRCSHYDRYPASDRTNSEQLYQGHNSCDQHRILKQRKL